MKKLDFFSNLFYTLKMRLGWCPEAPEPRGFWKFIGLPFVYVPVFKVRLVQAGLIIGLSIQTLSSIIGTIYFLPQFLVLIEKILIEPSGSPPPIEFLSAFFSIIPGFFILTSMPFVSSFIAGYTVGKVSSKLRYGMIIGIANLLLGTLISYGIGYSNASSFYTLYESLFNMGVVSSVSLIDIIGSWIRSALVLLASGGGGGAIGQLLGLRSKSRSNQDEEEEKSHEVL
jgi:hypothetical protein